MSEVPRTVEELKIEFGKNVMTIGLLADGYAAQAVEMALALSNATAFTETAERMRAEYAGDFVTYGVVAKRMLDASEKDPFMAAISMVTDLDSNRDGIADLLDRNLHPYFTELFHQATMAEPEAMRDCLRAMIAFGNGE